MDEINNDFMNGGFEAVGENEYIPFDRDGGGGKQQTESIDKAYRESTQKDYEEITLKFGKGLVGDTFEGKDGNSYTEIKIPNPDKNDHRPWQTFVVKENHVHANQFGKGMWVKLPADGHTTVRRNVKTGVDEQGKATWGVEKNKVSNRELKKMVEAYKERYKDQERGSIKDMIQEKKPIVEMQKPSAKPHDRAMGMAI